MASKLYYIEYPRNTYVRRTFANTANIQREREKRKLSGSAGAPGRNEVQECPQRVQRRRRVQEQGAADAHQCQPLPPGWGVLLPDDMPVRRSASVRRSDEVSHDMPAL